MSPDTDAPETACQVRLDFVNRMPRPFNAIWRFGGLTHWTRLLHVKDLLGLKRFSEPPHIDNQDKVVGMPPVGTNKYIR
ncbi:MAG: hypothetical protein AAF311_06090 [Pseudomonadota bacterium]